MFAGLAINYPGHGSRKVNESCDHNRKYSHGSSYATGRSVAKPQVESNSTVSHLFASMLCEQFLGRGAAEIPSRRQKEAEFLRGSIAVLTGDASGLVRGSDCL